MLRFLLICSIASLIQVSAFATKVISVNVVDNEYLHIFIQDGEVRFLENSIGESAYGSHNHNSNVNKVVKFGLPLDVSEAVNSTNFTISSSTDPAYANGKNPIACYRKTKLNGMAEMDWNTTLNDFNYEYTLEHSIFLKLPSKLKNGETYTIQLNKKLKVDVIEHKIKYDNFKNISEAIHINLVGYLSQNIKAADLYLWLGDGGPRDYSSFKDKKVYIINPDGSNPREVGKVAFWKQQSNEVGGYDLTASDVYSIDFTEFKTPGKYRISVEDVGCSNEFTIDDKIYLEPFRVSTLGFFYMRIGQDSSSIRPIPRRPLYIPGKSPSNTKVYITSMHPYHPKWKTFSGGDVWDKPADWNSFIKEGKPENNRAYGGHSDALDWDRHLGHVSIIYDMLLPYFLTDGKLDNDDCGIAESGNGIPDILDEAQNEVDFWVRLRHGQGYSHGLTNPTEANILYQADNTPIAAWANAANCAMLANCYQIAKKEKLMTTYRDSAIAAYNYASAMTNPMLDEKQDIGETTVRGKDLKIMAAAFLYNVTGDKKYEMVINELSVCNSENTSIIEVGKQNQLWATAAYLKTKQNVNFPALFKKMRTEILNQALAMEVNYSKNRPTRRTTDNNTGYFKTIQNVHRTIIAHAISDNVNEKNKYLDALILEADWGLGRNSSNIIFMTTATTKLAKMRSVESIYTSGRNDGTPGLHPGHTPYINTDDWSKGMVMGTPSWMTDKCYPKFDKWPRSDVYFNTRYVWSHTEFTPQQTMRGKAALYGYLYAINK